MGHSHEVTPLSEDVSRLNPEGRLLLSDQLFSKAFFTSHDMMVITDLETGECLQINNACKKILGRERSEWFDSTTVEHGLWPDNAKRKAYIKMLRKRGSVRDHVLVTRTKSGAECVLSLSSEIFHIDRRACVFSLLRDITRELRHEQELESSKNELERKNIALAEILDNVTREKEKLKNQIKLNLEKFILPALEGLRRNCSAIDQRKLGLIVSNIIDLTSSFGINLDALKDKLTPREAEIANLIKSGMNGKEIARTLNISYLSVITHRRNIRSKLGIERNVNLRHFLSSL